MKVLVTGGAGFIGSHLVSKFMEKGFFIRVFDNLASGTIRNIKKWIDCEGFEFIQGDLLNPGKIESAVQGCDYVYHLAGNPEADVKKASPEENFKQNITATYNLLEAIRKTGEIEVLVFTSSSTVYGEVDVYPTPEDYGPLIPISLYGASKLACESLFSAYSAMYGFKSRIFRLANIVGPRSNHGVIYDFILKLRKNPNVLEVLGDGSQSKSYLYISDCINGLLTGIESHEQIAIYNMGSEDRIKVLEIAEIVIEETGNTEARISLTGGINGGRGWKGDVKMMQLDTKKIREKGWKPKHNSAEAVRITSRSLYNTI
jgi:UDP-glucose 4-epimerase